MKIAAAILVAVLGLCSAHAEPKFVPLDQNPSIQARWEAEWEKTHNALSNGDPTKARTCWPRMSVAPNGEHTEVIVCR